MESIVFVRSIDCRACVLEIRDASKRKLERIVEHRKKCRKCMDCVRIQEIEKRLKS